MTRWPPLGLVQSRRGVPRPGDPTPSPGQVWSSMVRMGAVDGRYCFLILMGGCLVMSAIMETKSFSMNWHHFYSIPEAN